MSVPEWRIEAVTHDRIREDGPWFDVFKDGYIVAYDRFDLEEAMGIVRAQDPGAEVTVIDIDGYAESVRL